MDERYLSLAEACEVLGKSERTLYRWIKSGKLRAYKPGRDYEIPESAIRELRERSEVYPKDLAPQLPLELGQGEADEQRRSSLFVGVLRSYLWDLRLRRQEPDNRPSPGEIVGAIKLLQRLTDSGVFEEPWPPHDRLQIQWLTQAANTLKPVAEEFEVEGDEQKLDQGLEKIDNPLEQSNV